MYSRVADKDNENNDLQIPQGWIEKRRKTFVVFTIQNFLVGMEYSIFTLTLWLYLTTLIETSRPKLLYGIISSTFFIAGIILSPFYGKIVDNTRRARMAFLIGNAATCLGNFLYSVSFSPYFLIAGRLLAGLGSPIRAVINSEIARAYPSGNLTRYYSIIGIAFAGGFVIGPAVNSVFVGVDFKLFGVLHITDGNIVGLYMGCVYFLMTIVVLIFMSDLSREFDLKEETRRLEAVTGTDDVTTMKTFSEKLRFLADQSILLLLLLTFLMRYVPMSYDVSIPIIILDKLNWGERELNFVFLGFGSIGIVTLFLTILRPPSQRLIFKIVIISEFCIIGLVASLYLINILKSQIQYVGIILFLQAIMFNIIDLGDEICLPTIYAKIIPSENQTFAEAIRLSCARLGSLVSLMTTAYACDYMLEWLVIVAIVTVPMLIVSLFKRKIFFQ